MSIVDGNAAVRSLLERRGVPWRETMSGNTSWADCNGEDAVILHSDAGLVQLRAWESSRLPPSMQRLKGRCAPGSSYARWHFP